MAQIATHQEILPEFDSIYKSSFFDKKWGKWHFCDAPLNFTFFDLKIKPRSWTARAKKLKVGLFSFFFQRQVAVALVFSRIVISVADKNKKIKKAGFQFVGRCMINIVSKNHTQLRKIERGVANLPPWHLLGWPSSYACNDGVLTCTGYA